jgi:hypothetical protein
MRTVRSSFQLKRPFKRTAADGRSSAASSTSEASCGLSLRNVIDSPSVTAGATASGLGDSEHPANNVNAAASATAPHGNFTHVVLKIPLTAIIVPMCAARALQEC